jgi:hypothetical protein
MYCLRLGPKCKRKEKGLPSSPNAKPKGLKCPCFKLQIRAIRVGFNYAAVAFWIAFHNLTIFSSIDKFMSNKDNHIFSFLPSAICGCTGIWEHMLALIFLCEQFLVF